jgi:hypothetical protein
MAAISHCSVTACLSDIYLKCFSVKESDEGRRRLMVTEWTNKKYGKGIRETGDQSLLSLKRGPHFQTLSRVRVTIYGFWVGKWIYWTLLRGGLVSLWLYKENKLRDLEKYIYSTYSPLSSTHLRLRCSNFFNPSKKKSFGCAASRKIGNTKSQRLISTPAYSL